MRTTPRQRRYITSTVLFPARLCFRYSMTRDAFVLRGVGTRFGPVLREDRRRGHTGLDVPDRRGTRHDLAALRPLEAKNSAS